MRPPAVAHAALEHVAHAELPRDLAHIRSLALVDEAGVAGDDEQPAQARERGDDVLGDPVGEVLLLRLAAHVGEGQDGDRGPVRALTSALRPVRRREPASPASVDSRNCKLRMALDDRERPVREEADQELVDRRLAELRLEGELLPRDSLAGEIIPDCRRDAFLSVHRHSAEVRAENPESRSENPGKF